MKVLWKHLLAILSEASTFLWKIIKLKYSFLTICSDFPKFIFKVIFTYKKLDKILKPIDTKSSLKNQNKLSLSPKEYLDIYPTGSSSGKFYDTAKKYKLTPTENIGDLPIRPLISNIGTASYQLDKYLDKLLYPLSKSEYTVENNIEFINNIKSEKVPTGHSLISFEVKSLFT